MKNSLRLVALVMLVLSLFSPFILWGEVALGHDIGNGQFNGMWTGNGQDGKYVSANMQNTSSDALPGSWHPVVASNDGKLQMTLKTNSVGRLSGTLKMKIYTGYHLDNTHAIVIEGTFQEMSRSSDWSKMTIRYDFKIIDTSGIYYNRWGDAGSGTWVGTLETKWLSGEVYPREIKNGGQWKATISGGAAVVE